MDGLGYLWVSNYGKNRTGTAAATYQQDGGDNHPGWGYPLGDRKPDILQFGSNGLVAGTFPVDVNAFKGTVSDLAEVFSGEKQESISGGPLMALNDNEQQELLDKVRRIHHELTHNFQSRYPGSEFRDTAIGYQLENDRKLEDVHANMLPAIYRAVTKGEKKDG